MSVLIKGMEMPKKGVYDAVITFDGDSVSVRIPPSKEPVFSGIIVHVPAPHGRLIDAEKLAVKIWTEGHFVNGNYCEIAVDFTQSAPTIIEAEVSE